MKLFSPLLSICLLLPISLGLSSCELFSESVDAIIEGDSAAASGTTQQAFEALELGSYKQAVDLFEIAIQQTVSQEALAQLYNGLGKAYNKLDQFPEAIAAYQKSLELVPNAPQTWVNLGVVHRLAGDYEKALSAYQQALKLNPNLATAHSSIGSLYMLDDQPKLAIEAFKKALSLDETLAVTHGNLAIAYAMVGQFSLADTSLTQAIDLGYENGDLAQGQIEELKNKQ